MQEDTLIPQSQGIPPIRKRVLIPAVVLWNMKKHDNTYDYEKTKELIEKDSMNKATKLYNLTRTYLISEKKLKEWEEIDGRKHISSHEEMVDWSLGALFWTKELTISDVISYAEILDEEKDLIGMRQMPKEHDEEEGGEESLEE